MNYSTTSTHGDAKTVYIRYDPECFHHWQVCSLWERIRGRGLVKCRVCHARIGLRNHWLRV